MEKIRIHLFSALFLLNESLQLTLGFEMMGALQMHTYCVYGDIILEMRPHLSSASKHCQKRKTVLCDVIFPPLEEPWHFLFLHIPEWTIPSS
jgi:hypothetical protein